MATSGGSCPAHGCAAYSGFGGGSAACQCDRRTLLGRPCSGSRSPSAIRTGCRVWLSSDAGRDREESRNQFRARLNERLDKGTRSRIGTLKEQLKCERDPNTRDMIFRELGALYMEAEAYDMIEDAESRFDTPPADEIGNSETWQDALRRQREGYEPQSFTGIACPVLMLHGTSDPHPGKQTRDLLRASFRKSNTWNSTNADMNPGKNAMPAMPSSAIWRRG